MASAIMPSPHLTTYPRWVWALTGLTAATYIIWTVLDSGSRANTSSLHRRGAIRQPRRRSSPTQQLSANMHASTRQSDSSDDPSSPFGTITAQVNHRESIYQIGPNPPSLQQLERDFALSGATLLRIHTDMQHVLLDIIIDRLLEPDIQTALSSRGPTYSSLLPLIEPLQEKNIGDLLGLIHLLAGGGRDDLNGDSETEWRFEQANVAMAFARRCGVDVERGGAGGRSAPGSSLEVIDGDLADTVIDSNAGGNAREPGQGIKGLLYTIAEEQAKRSAYVHRGTRCDSCGEFPIRGVRWHCINCPDYDLCSNCEGQNPGVHPRTHVFAKIKIPISTLAQPHEVHDLWYPGDSLRHWSPLKVSLRKRLVAETGFEDVAVEAYYEQFTCTANVAYPEDPAEIRAAIDRRAFNKAMSSDRWPAPLEPNLLYDRMFAFYDTDNNSLIGFEEFVHGLAYLRRPSGYPVGYRERMQRALKGYDMDGDGLVSRADFARMFSAKYAVQRHIIRDVVAAEEAEIVAHTGDVVRSSQPISAAFTGEDVPYGERREPDMKRLDEFGEMQVAIQGRLGEATLPEDGGVWDGPTINSVARRYGRLDDIVSDGENFTLGRAEEVRRRYDRLERVPIPNPDEERGSTYLVETDPRSNRGRRDLEPPQERWRTDLHDAVAGGASGSTPQAEHEIGVESDGSIQAATNGDTLAAQQSAHNGSKHTDTSHNDMKADQAPEDGEDNNDENENDNFPDFIMTRGRAYEVPTAELDFGHDVMYQVIQEGINELLDPLFAEREALCEEVRNTRAERRKWRKEIDEFVEAKAALREQLRAGANVDPLLATALHSPHTRDNYVRHNLDEGRPGQAEGRGSWSPSQSPQPSITLLAGNEVRVAQQPGDRSHAPPPEPQDIASEIRSRIQHENTILPTDNEGIEDLENSIRQQSLDELLASAGYSIAAPVDGRPSLADEWVMARSAAPSPSPAPLASFTENHLHIDPTLPQNRPNDATVQISADNEILTREETEEEEEPMHLSPSSPPTPLPIQSPRSTASFSHKIGLRQNGHDKSDAENDSKPGPPSPSRLEHLARLDEEERNILIRGGPGRLTFEEVEEICGREGNGIISGLVESWLEWAGF